MQRKLPISITRVQRWTKAGEKEEMEKGRSRLYSPGARSTSLPVIGSAQERDLCEDFAQLAFIRPFVTLLTACPEESGETALILARFYMSPPAAPTASGPDASPGTATGKVPSIHILLLVPAVVNTKIALA
jgi:hypothetical protein